MTAWWILFGADLAGLLLIWYMTTHVDQMLRLTCRAVGHMRPATRGFKVNPWRCVRCREIVHDP